MKGLGRVANSARRERVVELCRKACATSALLARARNSADSIGVPSTERTEQGRAGFLTFPGRALLTGAMQANETCYAFARTSTSRLGRWWWFSIEGENTSPARHGPRPERLSSLVWRTDVSSPSRLPVSRLAAVGAGGAVGCAVRVLYGRCRFPLSHREQRVSCMLEAYFHCLATRACSPERPELTSCAAHAASFYRPCPAQAVASISNSDRRTYTGTSYP